MLQYIYCIASLIGLAILAYSKDDSEKDGWQVLLKQVVVSLVLKAQLADGQVGAGGLHVLNHLLEGLPFVAAQLLVVTDTLNLFLIHLLWAQR